MLNLLKILSTSKLTSSTAFGFLSLRDFTIEYIAFTGCFAVFNHLNLSWSIHDSVPNLVDIPNCNDLLHFIFWNWVTFICIIQLKRPLKYKRQIMIDLPGTLMSLRLSGAFFVSLTIKFVFEATSASYRNGFQKFFKCYNAWMVHIDIVKNILCKWCWISVREQLSICLNFCVGGLQ